MSLEIVRYSQEIDVRDPTKAVFMLVVVDGAGEEHRVPVTADTINSLALIAASPQGGEDRDEPVPTPSKRADVQKVAAPKEEDVYSSPPDGRTDPDDPEGNGPTPEEVKRYLERMARGEWDEEEDPGAPSL